VNPAYSMRTYPKRPLRTMSALGVHRGKAALSCGCKSHPATAPTGSKEMERGGEQWEIVSLPAEAEAGDLLGRKQGEWLWDDDYGYAAFLRHKKANQIPRNWSALYQQRPAPETGDYFKAEWFRTYVSEPPRGTLNVYGGSDYAVTSRGPLPITLATKPIDQQIDLAA
jgi:hypothetical protein